MSTHIALQAFRDLFRNRAESIRVSGIPRVRYAFGSLGGHACCFEQIVPHNYGVPAKKLAATVESLAPSGDDLAGLRGRALLLVGFAGALRRAELAAVYVEHIEPRVRRAPEPAPHTAASLSPSPSASPNSARSVRRTTGRTQPASPRGGCWTAAVEPTTLKHLGRNKGCAISMNIWSSVTSSIVTHSAGSVATSRTTAPPNREGPSEIAKNDRQ